MRQADRAPRARVQTGAIQTKLVRQGTDFFLDVGEKVRPPQLQSLSVYT